MLSDLEIKEILNYIAEKGYSSLLCILSKLKSILINNLNSGIDFLNLMKKKMKFTDMYLHMEMILDSI